ncbi:Lipoprotein 28 precursor [compost metagenome]
MPTAPLGLYAGRQKALASAKRGTTVAVPNDPTNMARALVMLKDLGWLKLKPGIDPLRASQHDIADNPRGVRLIQLEAAQLPRSRADVDFSVINGNYATSSGIRLTEALYQEKSDTYVNWGAIRTADRTQPWVKDLLAAYRSPEFQRWARQKFAGYKFPRDWSSHR